MFTYDNIAGVRLRLKIDICDDTSSPISENLFHLRVGKASRMNRFKCNIGPESTIFLTNQFEHPIICPIWGLKTVVIWLISVPEASRCCVMLSRYYNVVGALLKPGICSELEVGWIRKKTFERTSLPVALRVNSTQRWWGIVCKRRRPMCYFA